MTEFKKTNTVVTSLAKVTNKVEWANTIKQTQSEAEQAKIFYDAFRLALGKEEEFKETINTMRETINDQKTKIMVLTMDA